MIQNDFFIVPRLAVFRLSRCSALCHVSHAKDFSTQLELAIEDVQQRRIKSHDLHHVMCLQCPSECPSPARHARNVTLGPVRVSSAAAMS